MIGWLIFAGYAAAWFGASVFGTRWLADNLGVCNKERDQVRYKSTCRTYHSSGCWRPNGEITPDRFAAASALGLIWPLLIAPVFAWHVANKRPSLVDLQAEIARLEREVGMS